VPRKVGRYLQGHDVTTVPVQGWASIKNGKLLELIETLALTPSSVTTSGWSLTKTSRGALSLFCFSAPIISKRSSRMWEISRLRYKQPSLARSRTYMLAGLSRADSGIKDRHNGERLPDHAENDLAISYSSAMRNTK
jgi:hypothetical protein